MAKERLSKLQKDILTTLLASPNGDYEDIKVIDKNDTAGIDRVVKDGYKFTNEFLDWNTRKPTGELRYAKKIPKHQLRREALLFNVYDWQKYNRYTKECGYARIGWWKDKPDDYEKKQATLTRSLQTMCAGELVWLLDSFEQQISIYGKTFATKMGLKPQTIDEYRTEGLASYKKLYNKEKTKDPTVGTFEDWFDKPIQPQFGGVALGNITTRRKNFVVNYRSLYSRNIKYIRLTPQGLEKAKELLKVK